MNEEEGTGAHRAGEGYLHFVDWLNSKLATALGPPDIGPYDAVVEHVSSAVCPICGRPMSEHTIDHSTPNAILTCPAEHLPDLNADVPFNELGMLKRTS